MSFATENTGRIAIWLSSFIAIHLTVQAQPIKAIEDVIFQKKLHLFISSKHIIFQSAMTDSRSGEIEIQTPATYGFELGADIIYNFHRRYAISAGIYLGFQKTSYRFEADFTELYRNSTLFQGVTSWGEKNWQIPAYLAIPIGFHVRFPVNDRLIVPVCYLINPQHIIHARYEGNNTVETDSGDRYDVAFLTLAKRGTGFAFGQQLKTGFSYILKHNKLLNVNLVLNLNFNNPFRGNYRLVFDTPEATFGKYANSLNYLGLEIGYTLTGVKKPRKPTMRY